MGTYWRDDSNEYLQHVFLWRTPLIITKYHIKFDVNSGSVGYILPHWLEEEPSVQGERVDLVILVRSVHVASG